MADYLLFQKAQHKSFMMNSAKRRRMTRQGLLALLCQDRRFEFQKRSQLFIGLRFSAAQSPTALLALARR